MSAQAPVGLMVAGYRGALDRLSNVLKNPDATADDVFIPLFEALNWAASIDLFLIEGGTPVQDELLTGVRFARNRVHHQWAKALARVDTPAPGPRITLAETSSQRIEPRQEFFWYWLKAQQLPASTPPVRGLPSGEQEYKDKLAGNPAEETLVKLLPTLENL
jgi:hypothetical protein